MANAHHGHAGPCPNCGHELAAHDKFCSNCGQENHDLKIPLGHLLYELVEGLFHFDGKFFRTFAAIMTRPGKVVLDFLDGKRARYVPPVRLYIFISIVFFFLVHRCEESRETDNLGVSSKEGHTHINLGGRPGAKGAKKPEVEEANVDRAGNADSEIGIGIKSISRRGIVVSTGHQKLDERAYRLAFDGIVLPDTVLPQGDKSTMVDKQALFLRMMREQLLQQPDTAAYKHWRKGLKKALGFYRDALENEDGRDTLFLARNAFGQRILKYQPRVGFVPTDSVSMRSYLPLHKEEQIDSLLEHYHHEPTIFKRIIFSRGMFFYKATLRNRAGNLFEEVFWPVFMKYLSLSMFLLMPVAGFFLLIFFYMRRKYYYEHLIFSIYTHSTVFILFSLAFLFQMAFAETRFDEISDWICGLLVVSVLPYFILSLRQVYHQSWWLTILKSIFLFILYGVFLILLTVAIFLVSFITF